MAKNEGEEGGGRNNHACLWAAVGADGVALGEVAAGVRRVANLAHVTQGQGDGSLVGVVGAGGQEDCPGVPVVKPFHVGVVREAEGDLHGVAGVGVAQFVLGPLVVEGTAGLVVSSGAAGAAVTLETVDVGAESIVVAVGADGDVQQATGVALAHVNGEVALQNSQGFSIGLEVAHVEDDTAGASRGTVAGQGSAAGLTSRHTSCDQPFVANGVGNLQGSGTRSRLRGRVLSLHECSGAGQDECCHYNKNQSFHFNSPIFMAP